MSKTYDFLMECGTFFVATVDNGTPAVRPFGAVMELGGELYISTANTKAVYSQLVNNPSVQIVALKAGTRDWIRIDGKAVEVSDFNIKQSMLDTFPALKKRFPSKDCSDYAIFKIADMVSSINSNGEFIRVS
jgi:uncharacterized pyridoxamine 5'-phosphate oxidase family protein